MSGRGRVVVVGAGLAGLAAALRLEASGCEVTLIESGASPGGRLGTEELDGLRFDPWVQTLPGDSRNLRALVDQAGLSDTVLWQPLDHVAVASGGKLRPLSLRSGVRRGRAPGVPPWESWRIRRMRRLVDWFGESLDAHRPETATRLDDRSVGDFARLYCGPRAAARLFEPLFSSQLGLPPEETSRMALFLMLGGSGEPELQLGFGLGALAERLGATIRDKRLESAVESVRPDGRGVRLRGGEEVAADAVILAIPARDVLGVLPNPSPFEEVFFGSGAHETGVTLAIVADPPPDLPAPVLWVPELEGGLLASIVRVPLAHDADRALLLLTGRAALASAHAEGDERGAVESLLKGAERLLPGLRSRIRAQRLTRAARGVARFDVGHYRAIAHLHESVEKRRDERSVFFAGDYLVGPHLEGAATSGLRAAEEALSALS